MGLLDGIEPDDLPNDSIRLPDYQITQLPDARVEGMSKVATREVELEPIDRLEQKVKLLIAMVDRMKVDHAKVAEENQRLSRELESARARVVASESEAREVAALRTERDAIRVRVSDMLEQLEALSL
jgi:regulator of replication initiation timing